MTAILARTGYVARGANYFATEVVRNRRLILDLTRREFRSRYLGTAFGLIWAFVHPSVLTLIYFLFFKYVAGAGPIGGAPMVVWLLTGMVAWFIASDAVASGSSVILENRFLVKKVVFRVSLLPVVRLLSLLPVHLFFVVVIQVIDWGYGFPPSVYSLQVFYYLGCLMLCGLGWTWLMSAVVPFLKDVSQVIAVLVQVLFWTTPLVWNLGMIPERLRWVAGLNPLTYVVEGYRDSLITHVPFWTHWRTGLYFWAVTLTLLFVGGLVFARLRSHFADVL